MMAEKKKTYGPWGVYGVCPCGFKKTAPFGRKFHIHLNCCPDCGKDKDEWTIKKMRQVFRKGFLGLAILDGWEEYSGGHNEK